MELLVVIGIIALLIGILLPSLSKAREAANRTKCLSNCRQIAMGIVMYTQDNNSWFPFQGGSGRPEDWIWWKTNMTDATDGLTEYQHVAEHGIGPYLSLQTNPKVMLCPSDNVLEHTRNKATPYPYSYALNNLYTSEYAYDVTNGIGLSLWGNVPKFHGSNYVAAKITQVRSTADKICIEEESETTIDDGNCSMWCDYSNMQYMNLCSSRHDHGNVQNPQLELSPPATDVPNKSVRGVVGFLDGHAEFMARSSVHSKEHNLPNPELFDDQTYLNFPF